MAVKTATAPKTPGRAPEPERQPERDPNIIYNRKGEPVTLRYTGAEDQFDFDRSIIPQGWDYQWKVKTVKNMEMTNYQVMLAQNGWEPVPAERHDGLFMPRGYKGPIERGGQVLMERDVRLTIMSKQNEKRMADEPVRNSRNMAGMMSKVNPNISADSMDFSHNEARGANRMGVSRDRVSGSTNYTYTADE